MYKGSIIVTGCDSGLGLSLCRLLPLHDFFVIATCTSVDGQQKAINALCNSTKCIDIAVSDSENGFKICLYGASYVLDITSSMAVEEFQRKVISYVKCNTFPHLYALVNNAGIWRLSVFEDALSSPEKRCREVEMWREVMETNLFGTLRMTLAFASHISSTVSGLQPRILFISSVLDSHSLPGQGAYVTSKFAINGLYESLCHELYAQNIRPIIIRPGALRNTDLFRRDLRLDDPDYKVGLENDKDNLTASYRLLLNMAGDCNDVAQHVVRILEDSNPDGRISNITGALPFRIAEYTPRQVFIWLVRTVIYNLAKVYYSIRGIWSTTF